MIARVVIACALAMGLTESMHAQAPDPHAGHQAPAPPAPPAAVPGQPAPPADAHHGPEHGDHGQAESRRPAGAHEGHAPHAGGPVPVPTPPAEPRRGHTESAPPPASVALPPFIPPVTDGKRAAAFPEVHGHAVHDRAINTFVLLDQLEWRAGTGVAPGALSWSNAGWVGGDVHRLWFRTEGAGGEGTLDDAEAHALYGRAVARWWDLVAGVRQDFQPAGRTWLALGVQGLAPGFFEVQATAYVSDAGQTAARIEIEYDLLLTNRLVLQPLVETNLYGRTDESLGVGSGLSSGEAGFRLRYEFRREFAPYVGVAWVKTFGRTRALAHRDGGNGRPRLVTGVRVWF